VRPLALLLVILAVSAGCGAHGGCGGPSLRAEARVLVPGQARVLVVKDGACVELADFPSCVTVWFEDARSLSNRVREVTQRALGGGWKASGTHSGRGGETLAFRRDDLRAEVQLWSPLHAYFCKARGPEECADHLQVVRGG
jgi:hypothetical protein